MPREQINHPLVLSQRVPINDIAGPEGFGHIPWTDPTLHVGWHPGTWVQIGLEVDIDYARFAISSPNGSTSDRTQMWTDVLSLDQVDKLIATLKKARRKVFQRD